MTKKLTSGKTTGIELLSELLLDLAASRAFLEQVKARPKATLKDELWGKPASVTEPAQSKLRIATVG